MLYIKLFIIWMFFLDISSCLLCIEKPDLSILKTICVVRNNPNNMDRLPTNPKCTAIGLYADINDDENPVSASFEDIEKLRNGLPFVYVQNTKFHDEILNVMRPQNLDNYLKEQNKLITDHGIDVMIFDKLYIRRDIQKYDKQLDRNADQIRIHGLLRALKMLNPKVLLGMMISCDGNVLDDINLAYYDTVTDFYAFNTVHDWDGLISTATADNLNSIMEQMKSFGFNMNKSIITIELHITDIEMNVYSYATYCSQNITDKTYVYGDTLAGYYKKGLLVNIYNMSGAIIQSITDDDMDSKCCCGPFAGLKIIDAGIRGSPEPKNINCKTWANYNRRC